MFNFSHFSSTDCSEAMSKRTQQDSGEQSHSEVESGMMSCCKGSLNYVIFGVRKPGKKCYGCQSPWSAKAETDDSTVQPVVDRDASRQSMHHHKEFVESSYSARYSSWDDDKAWSSQEWKADKSMDDRTGQPVVASWARTHEFQSSFSHEKTKHVISEEE